MDSETIKAQTSMFDLLPRYGIEHRRGMVSCPLHTDNHPSMKIYKDGYKCFSCQAHGDVFDFVQMMEGVGFREAFRVLGGTEEESFSGYRARLRRQAMQEEKREEAERLKREQKLNFMAIDACRNLIEEAEPFSDVWCYCINRLQLEIYKMEVLHGMGDGW